MSNCYNVQMLNIPESVIVIADDIKYVKKGVEIEFFREKTMIGKFKSKYVVGWWTNTGSTNPTN